MSYHDFEPTSIEGSIGKVVYMAALDHRRGFRYDQLGIEDHGIWAEIFDDIGKAAVAAVVTGATMTRVMEQTDD